jgi:acyl-CoA hydrolase
MEARRASATFVEATHLVLPGQANALGSVFGGEVCAWIDLACSVSAMRLCHRPVVTASMDDLHFHAPVRVGHIAIVQSQVNAVFRTSLEVGAFVWSEDPSTGERRHTASAFLTFVALDANGTPTELPPLLCETEDERRREDEAAVRRAARLARKRATPAAVPFRALP